MNRFPLDWEQIFVRSAPLGIEIGCGNGEYLVRWAQTQPDWNFIGIELSLGSVERIVERVYKEGMTHVRLLRDDARFALRELFPDNSIRQVVMNFPDPWPKEKHQHRRLILPEFVQTLAAVLENRGSFELTTDQKWYAQQAEQVFEQNSCFITREIEVNPTRSVTTKYQRKWLAMGREVYRFCATKVKSSTVNRILENTEMPHVVIRQIPREETLRRLVGLVRKENEMVLNIKRLFTDESDGTFLLRTVTADGFYRQNFYILVAPHAGGTIVKIDPHSCPFRTPAVKFAIREIAAIIQREME
ncbi:MAG: tRNA (guanosine(46)-N7)-methyltransferase TrmB [Calditrichia bacterium]